MAASLLQINWSVPSWDVFIYLFFIVGVVLYGIALGRERVLAVLISIYVGLAISSNLPLLNEKTAAKFGLSSVFTFKLLVFAVILVLTFYAFSRVGVLDSLSASSKISHIFIFSLCQVGLLVSVILSFLPRAVIETFLPITRYLFTTDLARSLWILAPLLAMFFAKKS